MQKISEAVKRYPKLYSRAYFSELLISKVKQGYTLTEEEILQAERYAVVRTLQALTVSALNEREMWLSAREDFFSSLSQQFPTFVSIL